MIRIGVIAAACLALAAGAAGAGDTFRLPNKAIGCWYFAPSQGYAASLRCDVRGGLHPVPKRKCELDWTGVAISAKGPGQPECAGDTAIDRRAPILAFGKVWKRGPFTCHSSRYGVRCTTPSGHGIFLSRVRWRVH